MFSRRPTSLHPARGVAREAVDHVLIFGPAFAATLTANVMPEGCCNHSQASHLSRRSSADQSRTEGEMGKHQEAELRQHHCLTRRATISLPWYVPKTISPVREEKNDVPACSASTATTTSLAASDLSTNPRAPASSTSRTTCSSSVMVRIRIF